MSLRRVPQGSVPAQGEPLPPAPKVLSQATARAFLLERGWTEETGGKHVVKMVKKGCRPITLPRHKGADYGPSLRAAILRQARTGDGSESSVDL